jgi:hypothetical protein
MNNAKRILTELDSRLEGDVELTLYGRAALSLGFESPPKEFGESMDVDAVLSLGQAEALLETTNFWQAIEESNQALAESGLYVSHLFVEDQVILTSSWLANRLPIRGPWKRLKVLRLGNEDLLLSKLMRDDPHDRADALFIARRACLGIDQLEALLRRAVLPKNGEIAEQFDAASQSLRNSLQEESSS